MSIFKEIEFIWKIGSPAKCYDKYFASNILYIFAHYVRIEITTDDSSVRAYYGTPYIYYRSKISSYIYLDVT